MKNTIVKILLGIVIVPILIYFGYQGYQTYLAPEPAAIAATPEPEAVDTGPEVISAEGKILPAEYVQLSFKAPGRVAEVLAAKGDRVEAGQVIARLEGEDQGAAAVTAAQLELISAEQSLDDLYDHTDLRRAQSQQAVLDAQDQVEEAERVLRALTTPATDAQIRAAEEAVEVAEKNRETTRKRADGLSDERPGSADSAAAELALFAAERQYQYAVAYYNALTGEPDEGRIAEAEMNVEIAQINLEEAERELEILEEGPDPDEVALAQARVDNAEAQLAAAQAALDELNLIAPFDSEVIQMNLKVGEVSNPTTPGAVLADFSHWVVETTDLTEIDVSQISAGMEADITINAFPDRTFTGVVKAIDRQGVESRGSVTYAVTLDFDPGDATLYWGMSAFVEFPIP
jgi:multidrug resistance efflux pump